MSRKGLVSGESLLFAGVCERRGGGFPKLSSPNKLSNPPVREVNIFTFMAVFGQRLRVVKESSYVVHGMTYR